ncbi:MAG: extracellular solute-binding protein, partial [Eubacteriales bacterium]|nr:extracellular solute-binding protein [Eubacteriales bacterium]
AGAETASKEQAGAETNGDAVTIEVWSNNRHDEEYMTAKVEEFNASHSDIQIKYTIMTDDWANSIQLAYQANTAPDIITMSASDGMTLSDYVSSGMFESLTSYIDADEEFQKVTEAKDHIYEGLNAIGDDIYWVPNGVRSGTRIEYNTELVQAAGYEAIPSTLAELVTLCADVTANGGGSTYGVAFTSSGPFGRWLEGVGEMSGYTHGGYDYTTGTFDFSSWKPLLETAAKLYTDGSVLPGSETQGVDNSRALFAQGSFAIWGNASQEAGVFTEQFPCSFEWGVAELPTMDGQVNGALNCTPNFAFTMLTSSKNKDASWEVIKYFSSEDFLKGYFEGGYSAPLSDYMAGVIDESKVGRLADFALQDYEDVYPTIPAVTVEGDTYATVFWNVILGHITADEAIADLNTRYNDALERGLANGSCQRLIVEDYDPLHPSAGTSTYLTE